METNDNIYDVNLCQIFVPKKNVVYQSKARGKNMYALGIISCYALDNNILKEKKCGYTRY